ncbi:MAG: chemotaxis protein CheW [Phycisphaeraceae bacterium]|nr:chemotaxis protein CheW [Phycisphaeraceae bacterium]
MSTLDTQSLSSEQFTSRNGGDSGQLQLVTFDVAGEEFAVDILAVREINRMMSLTRVPNSPAEVEGVINLRGKIIPVIDLRRRFGMDQTQHSQDSRIVVVEVLERVVGFIVDRVHEVLRIEKSIVEPAPEMVCSIDSDFIAGVGKLEDRLVILLDVVKLFGDALMHKLDNMTKPA